MMQKFFLKYRNEWWWVLGALIATSIIAWLIGKLLDHLTTSLVPYAGWFKMLVSALNQFMHLTLQIEVSWIVALFISIALLIAIYRWRSRRKFRGQKLKILKATYGTESKHIDITRELNNAVVNDVLKVVLSNNIAGDPIFGAPKQGTVHYEYDGKPFTKEYVEGSVIDLPYH